MSGVAQSSFWHYVCTQSSEGLPTGLVTIYLWIALISPAFSHLQVQCLSDFMTLGFSDLLLSATRLPIPFSTVSVSVLIGFCDLSYFVTILSLSRVSQSIWWSLYSHSWLTRRDTKIPKSGLYSPVLAPTFYLSRNLPPLPLLPLHFPSASSLACKSVMCSIPGLETGKYGSFSPNFCLFLYVVLVDSQLPRIAIMIPYMELESDNKPKIN